MAPIFEITLIGYDIDVIELLIVASNGYFSGKTELCAGRKDLQKLSDQLKGFPSAPEDCRNFEFGDLDPKNRQGGIRMSFFCPHPTGQAVLNLKLKSAEGEYHKDPESSEFCIPIEAAGVDNFINQLNRINFIIGNKAKLI